MQKTKPQLETEERQELARNTRILLARGSFWWYCKVMFPLHYKESRPHLRELCNEMQAFAESDERIMVINAPPRHYKSFTATAFTQWWLGNHPSKKIMTGSYNATLSETFSKQVRNVIDTQKLDATKIIYSDIFPEVRIKRGDGASERWALQGQHATYLSTSPMGTATGFGCDLMIIDDLIKSAYEANNSGILEKQWKWFTDTMITRLEGDRKLILVMTRWHSKDLAGRAIKHFEEEGKKIRLITFKAHLGEGRMLCDSILSYPDYLENIRLIGAEIASANYQQEPIDIRGKLYSHFKTYEKLPVDEVGNSLFEGIYCYVDTADEGSDYLCAITYGEYHNEAYILDVYYTKAPMEETEQELARRLTEFHVGKVYIESNNGGRGFARNIVRILDEVIRNYYTVVKWFTQTRNKNSRILTTATWVMEHIYYPVNWKDKWSEYFETMNTYQREGHNEHDDAQDCTTGVAEYCSKNKGGVVTV